MNNVTNTKASIHSYFEKEASQRSKWKRRNPYYHALIEKYYRLLIPENSSVIEIGCSCGDLLASLKPSRGVGLDFSQNVIDIAKKKYPQYEFITQDIENLKLNEKFDYIILSDVVGSLWDVQLAFENINQLCHLSRFRSV